MTVEGLDAVFVGPSDLGLSLGSVPGNYEEPVLLKAIESVLKKAHTQGIRAGIYTLTADFARRMIELGYDYVVISSDVRLMVAQAKQVIADIRLK